MPLNEADVKAIEDEIVDRIHRVRCDSEEELDLLLDSLKALNGQKPGFVIPELMRNKMAALLSYVSPDFGIVLPENREEFLGIVRLVVSNMISFFCNMNARERPEYIKRQQADVYSRSRAMPPAYLQDAMKQQQLLEVHAMSEQVRTTELALQNTGQAAGQQNTVASCKVVLNLWQTWEPSQSTRKSGYQAMAATTIAPPGTSDTIRPVYDLRTSGKGHLPATDESDDIVPNTGTRFTCR